MVRFLDWIWIVFGASKLFRRGRGSNLDAVGSRIDRQGSRSNTYLLVLMALGCP